ncbi:MAG: hypothetical protein WCA49_01785 [Candidatus Sulfotelmatobacter sp.]
MSTAAVSTSSLNQQLQTFFQARNSDVQQLGQALSSGNLASAQVAYNNITALAQGGPFANGNAFRGSQREQDFNAIGQALQSGDLAGAQQAFAALKATGHNQAPQPVSNDPTGTTASSGPEIVINLSNSGSSTSPEQITIDIGNSSTGGEQVSLSVGNQGSAPQQVTLNLGANSNDEIVLNLLNGSSSTGSTASSSGSGGLSVSA